MPAAARRSARSIAFAFFAALALLAVATARAAEPGVGADLSSLAEMRAAGGVFRDGGVAGDPLAIVHGAGFGMVRLRLWHTPATPWNGLDSTLAAAVRARDAGMTWMLDLHYSDTWADPGQQAKPAAWAALPFAALEDSVYAYTRAVLHACVARGVAPRAVQLGNEIQGGLLWDDGRVGWPGSAWDTPAQWAKCTALLDAASRAVHDELPAGQRPEILLHLATPGDATTSRWFLDHVAAAGVEFDAIGMSYYPWWHGGLPAVAQNLHDLATRYGKRVWIVETSYPWTLASADTVGNFVTSESQALPGYPATPNGQSEFLRDLVALERSLPNDRGAGVLVWEPAMIPVAGGPPNPVENLALFDFAGESLPALRFAAPRPASPHASIAVVGDFNGWNVSAPSMTQVAPCVWMDTLSVTAGCWLFKFVTDESWDTPLDYGSCDGEHADCSTGSVGTSCLASGAGTALGRVAFAASGPYVFRLDERDWSYGIEPLALAGADIAAPAASWSLAAGPSPFTRSLAVRFTVPRASRVRLAVFDVAGRRVRELLDADVPASERGVTWDGTRDDGRDAAPGVYAVRLESGATTRTRRVLKLR